MEPHLSKTQIDKLLMHDFPSKAAYSKVLRHLVECEVCLDRAFEKVHAAGERHKYRRQQEKALFDKLKAGGMIVGEMEMPGGLAGALIKTSPQDLMRMMLGGDPSTTNNPAQMFAEVSPYRPDTVSRLVKYLVSAVREKLGKKEETTWENLGLVQIVQRENLRISEEFQGTLIVLWLSFQSMIRVMPSDVAADEAEATRLLATMFDQLLEELAIVKPPLPEPMLAAAKARFEKQRADQKAPNGPQAFGM